MRITEQQRKAIFSAVKQIVGAQAQVRLFGSRLHDDQKGGDIDLYLCPCQKFEDEKARRRKFLIKLDEYLGEQKIDAILAQNQNRLIEQEALRTGVAL